MSGETIKAMLDTNMFRGSYVTAEETPLDSPLAFVLWLAWQQYQRNIRSNHDACQLAANEELG